MAADVQTPVGNYIFKLNLGGAEAAGYFAEATGLSSESHVVEHTAADAKGLPLPQKFAGQVSWSNITLKRGVDAKAQLWQWRLTILEGQIDANRKDGQIDVLDWTGAIVVTYKFIRAWPCKYSSPGLNAGGNEILVEELELAHEGFQRA
ncbi:MAG TPA: phage tail protein [Solirubrobacteraceae bacterium]|nr:phage tail protein [Solirubrobacteraceae bacterium]